MIELAVTAPTAARVPICLMALHEPTLRRGSVGRSYSEMSAEVVQARAADGQRRASVGLVLYHTGGAH